MLTEALSVDLEKSLADVNDWLDNYITKPHNFLGRSGPVCPFVAPSRKANALRLRMCLAGVAPSVNLLSETIRCALEEFDTLTWPTSNAQLWSLLLIFPDLPVESLDMLDEAHAVMKPESVRRGMMIGQFHQNCTEKAARNPEFEVSRSPVPMVAIRRMAVHDVLFLSERREWFAEYVARFTDRYRASPGSVDPVLYETYVKACAEHGITP
jgi:hypothetical protein